MTRREEREHIFKLLFLTEFYKEEELEQQEMMYYEGISDAKQEDLTYIRKKYEKIKENLEQIDGQINEALIMVGFLMLTSITKIDFSDYTEAIPCFIAIIAMPFMYSISEGIAMGVISYVVLNVATGKAKEKKISILMYVLAVLFILKYVVL